MKYSDLQAELSLPQYAATSNSVAAAMLMAPIVVKTAVRTKDIDKYFAMAGVIGGIQIAAHGNDDAAGLCQTVLRVLDRFEDLNFDDAQVLASVTSMLTSLQALGLISAENKDHILGMGDKTINRAYQIGWTDGLSPDEVRHARETLG